MCVTILSMWYVSCFFCCCCYLDVVIGGLVSLLCGESCLWGIRVGGFADWILEACGVEGYVCG